MLRNLPWTDRIGVLVAFCAVFGIAFLWLIGFAGLVSVGLAVLLACIFTVLVIWAGNLADEDPDNDSIGAALAEGRVEAGNAVTTVREKWTEVIAGAAKKPDVPTK